jgi:hypothetical protein
MGGFLRRIGRDPRGLHGDERRRAVWTGTAQHRGAAEAKRRMAGAGYFAWRCKGASAPTENSRRPPLLGRAARRTGRPLKKAVGAVLSDEAADVVGRSSTVATAPPAS